MSKRDYVVNPAMPSPICVPCWDFSADGVQREKRTVVIAPIIVQELEEGLFQYSYGCSRGPSCKDGECRYGHKEKKRRENPALGIEPFGTFGDR